MRFTTALLLSCMVLVAMPFNTSPDTKYDWDEHWSGEDLRVSLTNEPGVIFVVTFFQTAEDDEVLSKANDSLRNTLRNDLSSHDEVVYTEVDLTASDDEDQQKVIDSYKQLAESDMGIDLDLLATGPIVTVMNRGEGSWVHGKGQPVTDDADWETGQDSFEQILDSIETFIAEARDRKQGGTGNVAGSRQANRGGLVSVGNQAYPY